MKYQRPIMVSDYYASATLSKVRGSPHTFIHTTYIIYTYIIFMVFYYPPILIICQLYYLWRLLAYMVGSLPSIFQLRITRIYARLGFERSPCRHPYGFSLFIVVWKAYSFVISVFIDIPVCKAYLAVNVLVKSLFRRLHRGGCVMPRCRLCPKKRATRELQWEDQSRRRENDLSLKLLNSYEITTYITVFQNSELFDVEVQL